jgi:hypothetical protein
MKRDARSRKLESGNILPFALIMTMTILLAGIGIGTVVLEGVKRAKDTDESVGAYYMADSGVERQLFEIRKNNQTLSFVNSLDEKTPPIYPSGRSWKSTGAFEAPTVKTIPSVATSSFAVLDLFNPDDLLVKPGIGVVKIAWSSGTCSPSLPAKLEASYAYWDLSGPTPTWPSDNQYVVLSKSTAGTLDLSSLDPNRAYRLRLRFFDCPASNVTVTTYEADGTTPKPFPGDITLSAEGTYGRATQKIAVTMPKQDVLSGLFGYVIFSECTLYKGEGTAPVCP